MHTIPAGHVLMAYGLKHEAPAATLSKQFPAMVRVLRPARFRDRRLQNSIRWTVVRRRSGLTVVPTRITAEEAAEITAMQRAARAAEDLRQEQARAGLEAGEIRRRERAVRAGDNLWRQQEREAELIEESTRIYAGHEVTDDITTYIATPIRNERTMVVRGVRRGAVHLNVRLPSHAMSRLHTEFLGRMASMVNEALVDYYINLHNRAAGA